MEMNLTQNETRVIGCLIEKETTTPEQYPLSLNALTNACNQKSNREPVLALDEIIVQETVDGLIKKHMASEKSGFGHRATKFKHRFCNTEFGELKLTEQELGIICVMLLRGPQTPGELRTRTNRLCKFSDVGEVDDVLTHLMQREDGPFMVKLPREPGKRESRYAHLFSGEVSLPEVTEASHPVSKLSNSDHGRLAQLEQTVSQLLDEVDHIKSEIEELKNS